MRDISQALSAGHDSRVWTVRYQYSTLLHRYNYQEEKSALKRREKLGDTLQRAMSKSFLGY